MIRSKGETVFDIFNILFIGFISIITIFPFWNVVMTSFVKSNEFYTRTFILWPREFNISAYYYIFSTRWIASGFKVSTIVTVFGTIYNMFLVVTASYGLSKKTLPGRNFFITYFIITMYFGGGLIPYYLVVTKYLKLTDNLLSLIITGGLSVYYFLILKNFFNEIPVSLAESATIDGANEFVILFRIILPLSMPAIATLLLFNAVGYWNEWQKALYFIIDDYKFPLQMILRKIVIDPNSATAMRSQMNTAYQNLVGGTDETLFDEAVKAATVVVVTTPIILVYPFLQKYFAKGVMIGSIKG
jgi:putative aldouronate transport system permease protein